MSMSNQIINKDLYSIDGALLEKITLGNDLSGLSPIEKVKYVGKICKTLGLNPITRPIQIIKFQGKEIPYFAKDATEQLRKINNVSINKVESKILDDGIYIVTAYATMPDGRQDSSTGVISISGLKGEALSNAMMKAETKSKRRVTLSICGLGFMDESEIESLTPNKKINVHVIEDKKLEVINESLDDHILDISQANTLDELQDIYTKHYKYWVTNQDKESLNRLVLAKDKKKSELTVKEFNDEINESVDQETGEVKS